MPPRRGTRSSRGWRRPCGRPGRRPARRLTPEPPGCRRRRPPRRSRSGSRPRWWRPGLPLTMRRSAASSRVASRRSATPNRGCARLSRRRPRCSWRRRPPRARLHCRGSGARWRACSCRSACSRRPLSGGLVWTRQWGRQQAPWRRCAPRLRPVSWPLQGGTRRSALWLPACRRRSAAEWQKPTPYAPTPQRAMVPTARRSRLSAQPTMSFVRLRLCSARNC
mmetsp:Transcript_86249/g.272055  ORF Transcript_86249/g.272055 Transcript_86249/m.272055 type:complete len:222 (+) Transcript_86249:659-1324(+)